MELGRTAPRRLHRIGAWAATWADRPWFPATVALLAVLLSLPSLGVGWIVDDYYHRTILLGRSPLCEVLGTPAEMFRFFRGEPGRTGRLVDIGLFPWWTDLYLKAEFLQALTVLTHRLDYALWPDSAPLMHAQNLFWLGTMVAAVAAFYRRTLGPTWVGALAALLFALDDVRGSTAGTICNRNVLIAATFGVSALILHDRWRRSGSRVSAVLAPVLLCAALFAKEEGIGTCAYLAAYALFLDAAGLGRRFLSLTPYLAVVLVWRTLRSSWGYGVQDMGLYIDPLTDPVPFARAAVERIPILLLGQWSPIPSEIGIPLSARMYAGVWWGSVAFLSVVLVVFVPLLRRDRLARFWAVGMILATIPVAATFPMDRLLTLVGLGASGLLAQFLAFAFGGSAGAPPNGAGRVATRALAWLFLVVHAIAAPLFLPFRANNPVGPKWIEHRFNVGVPLGPGVEEQTLVIVNAPSPVHAHYLLLQRGVDDKPLPKFIRVLAPAIPSIVIRRIDDRTLAIRPGNGYIAWVLDRVFRSERRPMSLGQRVSVPGMEVEITAMTSDGRPAEAAFRFDVPLESPSLLWLCYRRGRFEPFTPPGIGRESVIRFDWWALANPFASPSQASTAP